MAWSQSVGAGRLYRKAISVLDERDGRQYSFNVALLLYAASSQEFIGEVVEQFTATFDPPTTLQVGPDLHERLTERFKEVDYFLTFAANGRIGGRVPRTDFDTVSLGDEVDVLAYDWLDVDAYNRVVSVADRELDVSEEEVTTYPLTEAYPD